MAAPPTWAGTPVRCTCRWRRSSATTAITGSGAASAPHQRRACRPPSAGGGCGATSRWWSTTTGTGPVRRARLVVLGAAELGDVGSSTVAGGVDRGRQELQTGPVQSAGSDITVAHDDLYAGGRWSSQPTNFRSRGGRYRARRTRARTIPQESEPVDRVAGHIPVPAICPACRCSVRTEVSGIERLAALAAEVSAERVGGRVLRLGSGRQSSWRRCKSCRPRRGAVSGFLMRSGALPDRPVATRSGPAGVPDPDRDVTQRDAGGRGDALAGVVPRTGWVRSAGIDLGM